MTNMNAHQRGGKSGLIAALIVANLLMLAMGIITIPPNLGVSEEKKSSAPRTEQSAPVTPASEKAIVRASSAEESTPIGTVEPEAETRWVDTSTPTDAPAAAPEDNPSTQERPDLGDFLWYTEDMQYNSIPTDANIIDNLGSLTGGWKGLILYDPDNKFDSNAMEFLNIDIAGTEEDLSLTLDWYLIFWSDEEKSFDESDMEDSVFNGEWENGGLWASGAGTIRLTQFYEQNGKQYAVGTMDMPDGIPALVALVRP